MWLKPASTNVRETQLPAPRTRKRQWTSEEELDDNPAQFRRVRLRYCDRYFDMNRLSDAFRQHHLECVKLQQQITASFDRQSF